MASRLFQSNLAIILLDNRTSRFTNVSALPNARQSTVPPRTFFMKARIR